MSQLETPTNETTTTTSIDVKTDPENPVWFIKHSRFECEYFLPHPDKFITIKRGDCWCKEKLPGQTTLHSVSGKLIGQTTESDTEILTSQMDKKARLKVGEAIIRVTKGVSRLSVRCVLPELNNKLTKYETLILIGQFSVRSDEEGTQALLTRIKHAVATFKNGVLDTSDLDLSKVRVDDCVDPWRCILL
jgi:hypothetical protein